jgi:IS5 family transposase
MKQQDLGLNLSTRRTRKAVFLDEMNLVVPWAELLSLIAPHTPRARTGRPPFELATMLRIHFLSNSGLVCRTWRWKKRCSRPRCTVSLQASPAWNAFPTESASCAFATCSKSTSWLGPIRFCGW